jgi:hypothetical protein
LGASLDLQRVRLRADLRPQHWPEIAITAVAPADVRS